MSRLACKTKAGERPQGKPNVYFSCHPEDHRRFFEEYAGKILGIQDCAVWYEAEPEADCDREELELDLSQMQLMVMPVTTELLTTQNRAIDVELPIAKERHIPVLPLMMEQGLNALFSERFGDLQYLDPNDNDPTRRSFDEVLRSYIKSVLISDEVAEKVRAAFDAYIFLSYRKKDRKMAQSLMRLIHRNPLCRDIAIWYDEFLTPGEDFNQAIGKMLKKSDLMALVVTPNLVNEVNYVMTTEYPAAMEQQKPILPVEMEATDRTQLEEHYGAIPPCVRGEESEAFTTALTKIILRLAVEEKERDPVHNYLIGLAYLDGIDVEIDSARALELITGAAEAGIPEAMAQLVTMYENGKGVARDYREGVKWRVRHVDCLRQAYAAAPTEELADELIAALWSLGDAQYELRDLDATEAAYAEMNSLSEQRAASGSEQSRRLLALSNQKLGELAKAEGDLAAASKYFEKAYFISRELAEQTGTVAARRSLWISYVFLGDLGKARENEETAQVFYKLALDISEELVRKTGSIESRRDLWVSCEKLGDMAMARGDLAEAQKYYEKIRAIIEGLTRQGGTIKIFSELAITYNRLGNLAKAKGDLGQAHKYYEANLSISTILAEQVGTIKLRRQLAVAYDRLADLERDKGDLAEAQRLFEQGLAIKEDISKQVRTIESVEDLLVSYENLGQITEERGDLAAAQRYCHLAVYIGEGLAARTGTTEIKECLWRNYERLGDMAKAAGDFSAAQQYYERAVFASSELAVRRRTTLAGFTVYTDYEKVAEAAKANGDLAIAQEYDERARVLFKSLMARMREELEEQAEENKR